MTNSIWRQRSKQQYLEGENEDACCWLGHYCNYALYSNYIALMESTVLLKCSFYRHTVNSKFESKKCSYFSLHAPRRKVTDAITATNNSISEVPSIKNMTDILKLSSNMTVQNTQKKNKFNKTQVVA